MAKSPEETRKDMIKKLPETTGKSLAEWQVLIEASGRTRHGEIVQFLKAEHGVTHGYANQIALQVLKPPETSAEDEGLLEVQYGGAKSRLRPIYEALVKAVKAFGSDVEISPKKAYVSLRRTKQFAIVQPSTASRLDVGLVLPGIDSTDRLEAAGSFNAMMTHRVRMENESKVDKELIGWLRQAYDQAERRASSARQS
jgi:predicted transport protein